MHKRRDFRLIVRPDALQNRNRQDYLMRLAEANGLDGIADLCKVLHTSYTVLASLPGEKLNAILSGVPIGIVAPQAEPIHGLNARRYGLSNDARVCPKCIEEHRSQSVVFNFMLPVCCPVHRSLPIDTCGACNSPIRYSRRFTQFCDCGESLAKSAMIESPTWLATFYGIFAPWHLANLDDLSDRDAAARDFRAMKLVRNITGGPTYERVGVADFPLISRLIDDWPRNLNKFLEERSGQPKTDKRKLLHSLRGHTEPLNRAIDALRSNKVSAPYEVKKLMPQSVRGKKIRELAKLDAAAVRDYVSSLGNDAISMEINGRNSHWISEVHFRKLNAHFANTLDLVAAARFLNCEELCLRALAKMGFVRSELLAVKPRSPRFPVEALKEWLETLERGCITILNDTSGLVSIASIKAHNPSGEIRRVWCRLMERVSSRRMALYRNTSEEGMLSFYVGVDDLIRLGFRTATFRQ